MTDRARLSTVYRKIINHDSLDDADLAVIKSDSALSFHTPKHTRKVNIVRAAQTYTLECVCQCAFEHEYFDHINTSRLINIDKLGQICDSLENNGCPHVVLENIEAKTVLTTVSMLHVAIAADNTDVYKKLTPHSSNGNRSTVFQLTGLQLAIVKQRHAYIEHVFEHVLDAEHMRKLACSKIVYFQPSEPTTDMPKRMFHYNGYCTTLLNLSIDLEDIPMIRIFWREPMSNIGRHEPIEYSVRKKKFTVTSILLDLVKNTDLQLNTRLMTQGAVLDNDPEALEFLAQNDLINGNSYLNTTINCLDLAIHLEYESCVRILKTCVSPVHVRENNLSYELFSLVLAVLFKGINQELCCKLLRRLVETGHDINCLQDGVSHLLREIPCRLPGLCTFKYPVIRTLIELGSNLNICDTNGETVLLKLLTCRFRNRAALLTVRAILYRNPRITSSPPQCFEYIRRAVVLDSKRLKPFVNIPGEFWIFHNRPNPTVADTAEWVLENSVTYLLWECGYPIATNILTNDHVQSSIRELLADVTSSPRQLKLLCRDKLREHFHDMNIHTFVNESDFPPAIKKFILMENLLNVDTEDPNVI